MQERTFTGRIANLAIFSLVEFGTRARFNIECGVRSPIVCAVEGNARGNSSRITARAIWWR